MIKTLIIGSGPAGLTASIYLARAGLEPIVMCGESPGGQLIKTTTVENFPGFHSILGADLMMKMLSQAENLGSKIKYESVQKIEKVEEGFTAHLESGEKIDSQTILIATGAKHKNLGIKGEKEYTNRGVSWCATCDGALYKDKDIAVVGGGNTAVMEALYLSNIAKKVYLIHRRDSLKAEQVMQERLFSKKNIECLWGKEIEEIKGTEKLQSIILKTGENLNVSALFEAIGVTPETRIVKDLLELDEEGYIKTDRTQTSIAGIYAAGDVESGSAKQAIYAAGQGCLAAQEIMKYLGIR